MSTSAPHTPRIPGCTTPAQEAAFMATAAQKLRGSPAAAPSHRELVEHFASNQGRISSADTPEAVAEFVVSVGARRRSVAAAAPAATPAPTADPDMETAEGIAAFVLSAGRRNGSAK